MSADQFAITVFGLLALWLNQDLRLSVRRWGSVFGLMAQPAWFYSAVLANQRGAMLMCVAYTLIYMRGIRLGWGRANG